MANIEKSDLFVVQRPAGADAGTYKTSASDIIEFVNEEGQSVIVSPTPPATDGLNEGTLWWNSDASDLQLYVLYDDADPDQGMKWVEASPMPSPTNPDGYPDLGNGETLDGRYVETEPAGGASQNVEGPLTIQSGKISLNADGSADFAGNVTSGEIEDNGNTASNAGTIIRSSGGISAKRSDLDTNPIFKGFNVAGSAVTSQINGNGTVFIGGTLPSAPNISLNADGSASFALSADVGADALNGNVRSYGLIAFSKSASNGGDGINQNASVYARNFVDGGPNVGGRNYIGVSSSNETTFEVFTDGSATFAGDIGIGGTLPSAPNISLKSDGSAEIGNTKINLTNIQHNSSSTGSKSDLSLSIGGSFSGANRFAFAFSDTLNASSLNELQFFYDIGNDYVFLEDKFTVGGAYNNPNISLNADGSASFAKDIEVNGVDIGRGGGDVATNTAVGNDALAAATGGSNVAVGYRSLNANTTAGNNTSIGHSSLLSNTTGGANTAIGQGALSSNVSGGQNSVYGRLALGDNVSGSNNTVAGVNALGANVAGSNGVAIGVESQRYANDTTTPFNNTNVSVGYQSLRGSATPANNTGINNTAVGYQSMLNNTSGDGNTATGRNTLLNNTTGEFNTGNGQGALYDNTTGSNNTAFGNRALDENQTGNYNTAIGNDAGRYTQAGANATVFSNCSYLGHDSRASGGSQVQLGDTRTTTYAYGAVQDRSDERDKTDIRDTLLGLEFVKSLRPVDFRWDMRDDYFDKEEVTLKDGTVEERLVAKAKDGSRSRTRFHHGLIAQEVKAAADAQGIDFAGYQDHSVNGGCDVLSIGYTELIAPLIKAVQELSAENADLKARLDAAGI